MVTMTCEGVEASPARACEGIKGDAGRSAEAANVALAATPALKNVRREVVWGRGAACCMGILSVGVGLGAARPLKGSGVRLGSCDENRSLVHRVAQYLFE